MALITRRRTPTARHGEVYYPESDGKPMAETDVHRRQMMSLISALDWRYRDDPLVYVSGNLLLYYEEGNPRKSVAPDTFVVKGVPKRLRPTYLLWAEGESPCVVFEVTSKSTRREDLVTKHALYAGLGVREYFLFDPLEEYLRPSLQGFRPVGEGYVPITPDAEGALECNELGLRLMRVGLRLRLMDVATGADVADDRARAEAERARAEAEHARAEAAEAELARLRVMLGQSPPGDGESRR